MPANGILVDTDVFSYVAWGRARGEPFVPILRDSLPAVSFVTVGELFCGAVSARWGARRIGELEAILKRYAVIPGTYDIARAYGEVKAAFRDQVDECDMWIAATAIAHDLPIVTNNLRHFEPLSERFGFRILHPDST